MTYTLPKSIIEVTTPAQIPEGSNYTIIVYDTVLTATDFTNDPNLLSEYTFYTRDICKHYVTTDRDAWEDTIKLLLDDDSYKNSFVAFRVDKLAKINTTITID